MQASLLGVEPYLGLQKGHRDLHKFVYDNKKGKHHSVHAVCTVVSHLLFKKDELGTPETMALEPNPAVLSLAKAVDMADKALLAPDSNHHITGLTSDLISGGWVLELLQDYNPDLLQALVRPLSLH